MFALLPHAAPPRGRVVSAPAGRDVGASSAVAPPPAALWASLGAAAGEKPRTNGKAARAREREGLREPRRTDAAADDVGPAWRGGRDDDASSAGWEVMETREGSDHRPLPAEMRCFDRAKIYVAAGDGGAGATSFRREACVPQGGPDGGNGGDGGYVYVVGDAALNSLLSFRKQVHFRAGRGGNGEGANCYGRSGGDVTVRVPLGTLLRDAETGALLAEVLTHGQPRLVLKGGRGGRGNASFKSNRNRAPMLSEKGEAGLDAWLRLELQICADVGIVGQPNAGKSTLLAAVSGARPKIASYAFTTLVPNLGVCEQDYTQTVFADIPGLVEGASLGVGLGHQFLAHCLRCRVLVHVLDGAAAGEVGPDGTTERGAAALIGAFHAIQTELAAFSPALATKPQIVAINKLDLPAARRVLPALQAYFEKQRAARPSPGGGAAAATSHPHSVGFNASPPPLPAVFCVSAATGEGVAEVIRGVRSLLATLPPPPPPKPLSPAEAATPVAADIASSREGQLSDFVITRDGPAFVVEGAALARFTQMTNWEFFESVQRFSLVLKKCGVWGALKAAGAKQGDPVIIGTMEMAWEDEDDEGALFDNWRRSGLAGPTRGARHWPHNAG